MLYFYHSKDYVIVKVSESVTKFFVFPFFEKKKKKSYISANKVEKSRR